MFSTHDFLAFLVLRESLTQMSRKMGSISSIQIYKLRETWLVLFDFVIFYCWHKNWSTSKNNQCQDVGCLAHDLHILNFLAKLLQQINQINIFVSQHLASQPHVAPSFPFSQSQKLNTNVGETSSIKLKSVIPQMPPKTCEFIHFKRGPFKNSPLIFSGFSALVAFQVGCFWNEKTTFANQKTSRCFASNFFLNYKAPSLYFEMRKSIIWNLLKTHIKDYKKAIIEWVLF